MVGRALILCDKITQCSNNIALRLPSFQVQTVVLACLRVISKVKMSDKCKVCCRNINARNAKAQCTDCQGSFHASCINMTEDDVKFIQSQNEVWRCDDCKKKKRESLRLESAIETQGASNEDVIKLLQEMRAESKRQIDHLETELGKSVENCHAKIGDLLTKFNEQSEIMKNFEGRFEVVIQENTNLKAKVKSLEVRLDEMEQYSRVNCLEINGVPEAENENTYDVVQAVGHSLGIEITEDMVDACHRLGSKQEGRKRGIIVKFTRRDVKEDVLNKRKIKRNFNTHDLNIKNSPAEVVYINESLSPNRRKILNAARALKREKGYTFVWVRNGRVFLRKSEGDPVIVATSIDQVAAL